VLLYALDWKHCLESTTSTEHQSRWPTLISRRRVRNVEIENLKRLQFCLFAGDELRGRSKGPEITNPVAFAPQFLRPRGPLIQRSRGSLRDMFMYDWSFRSK
jgi:hypothetical protein